MRKTEKFLKLAELGIHISERLKISPALTYPSKEPIKTNLIIKQISVYAM